MDYWLKQNEKVTRVRLFRVTFYVVKRLACNSGNTPSGLFYAVESATPSLRAVGKAIRNRSSERNAFTHTLCPDCFVALLLSMTVDGKVLAMKGTDTVYSVRPLIVFASLLQKLLADGSRGLWRFASVRVVKVFRGRKLCFMAYRIGPRGKSFRQAFYKRLEKRYAKNFFIICKNSPTSRSSREAI